MEEKKMKTLKKVFCVTLVLTLMMGIVPLASALTTSSDYVDADDITYKEAVDVLSALGIVEGTGSAGLRYFRPRDFVTRAEAATIITRLMLGRAVADSLPATATIFTDVRASHWASRYIAYCVSQGIVAGYGNGRFGPDNRVTSSQFAAMLLRAIGYGRQGEYEGRMWETNVIVDAMRVGILDLNINFQLNADREQTAKYAFNALLVDMVVWSRDTQSYVTVSGPQKTIAARYHRDLNYVPVAFDAFGRPGSQWRLGNELIGSYFTRASLTFTDKVSERDIFRGLGLRTTFNGTGKGNLIIDGDAALDQSIANDSDRFIPGTGRGVLTEVYYDGTNLTIIVINTWLGVVTHVTEAAWGNPRTIDLIVFPGGSAPSYLIRAYETDYFSKDDVVLLNLTSNTTWDASDIQSIKLARVSGNVGINFFTGSNNVGFGGATYYYAANAVYGITLRGHENSLNTGYGFNGTYTFFLDEYGNILGNEEYTPGVTNLNYAYVRDVRIVAGVGVGVFAQQPVAKVELVYLDGSAEVLDMTIHTARTNFPSGNYFGNPANGDIRPGDLYITFKDADGNDQYYFVGGRAAGNEPAGGGSATELWDAILTARLISFSMADGRVTLSRVVKAGTTEAVRAGNFITFNFIRNTPTVSAGLAVFANANTRLVTRLNGVSTTYDGFRNFPTGSAGTVTTNHTSDTNSVEVIYVRNETRLIEVLVVGESFTPGASPDGYAVWTGSSRHVPAGIEYRLFVNGAYGWYLMDNAPDRAFDTVYPFSFNTSNNKATLGTPAADISNSVQVDRVDSSYLVLSGNVAQMFAPSCRFYNISNTNSELWTEISLSGLRSGMQVICVTETVDGVPNVAVAIFVIPSP